MKKTPKKCLIVNCLDKVVKGNASFVVSIKMLKTVNIRFTAWRCFSWLYIIFWSVYHIQSSNVLLSIKYCHVYLTQLRYSIVYTLIISYEKKIFILKPLCHLPSIYLAQVGLGVLLKMIKNKWIYAEGGGLNAYIFPILHSLQTASAILSLLNQWNVEKTLFKP